MRTLASTLEPGAPLLVDDFPHELWFDVSEGNWQSGIAEIAARRRLRARTVADGLAAGRPRDRAQTRRGGRPPTASRSCRATGSIASTRWASSASCARAPASMSRSESSKTRSSRCLSCPRPTDKPAPIPVARVRPRESGTSCVVGDQPPSRAGRCTRRAHGSFIHRSRPGAMPCPRHDREPRTGSAASSRFISGAAHSRSPSLATSARRRAAFPRSPRTIKALPRTSSGASASLDMDNASITVDQPMVLGRTIDLKENINLVGIIAVGQNRWMFRTRVLAKVNIEASGGAQRHHRAAPQDAHRCRTLPASQLLPRLDRRPRPPGRHHVPADQTCAARSSPRPPVATRSSRSGIVLSPARSGPTARCR